MVRKTIDVPDELWKAFERKAVEKFGAYGSLKKAVREAFELWLKAS